MTVDTLTPNSDPSFPSNKKRLLMAGGLGLALLALIALALLGWQRLAGPPTDLSGVWTILGGNTTLVLEKQDDDYRLSRGGRRLTVKGVDHDRVNRQLNLTVLTDSGLLATWSLHMGRVGENPEFLYLIQDGFTEEVYARQRELTAADRARLAKAKPARQPRWSPSFDCGKATTDIERMICTSPRLGELDAYVASFLQDKDTARELKESQRHWITAVRDACTSIGCLEKAYQARMASLLETTIIPEFPPPPADVCEECEEAGPENSEPEVPAEDAGVVMHFLPGNTSC